MQFEYQITAQDLFNAQQLHSKGKISHIAARLWLVFAILLFSFCIYFGVSGQMQILSNPNSNSLFAIPLVQTFLILLFALFFNYGTFITLRLRYKHMANLHGTFTSVISPHGIEQSSSQGAATHIDWAKFIAWRESRSVFILLSSKTSYMLLPKRTMSAEQTAELRTLLGQVLPKK